MILNAQTHPFLTNIGERLRNLGFIAKNRLTDEERTWLKMDEGDGNNLDPDLYRQEIRPEGARYVRGMIIDAREAVHDSTNLKKSPELK